MKKTSLIVVVCMFIFGGFIGSNLNTPTGSLTAAPPAAPIFVERPNYDPLNLRLDLKSGELTVDGSRQNVNLSVQQEDKVVATPSEYKTKTIIAYVENQSMVNRLLNKFVPLPNAIAPKFDSSIPNTIGTAREE